MGPKRQQRRERDALELVEEAVHLLRRAPAGALAAYMTGTLPFLLGFLYFWADMSRSSFAHGRATEAALVMALLYFWMKTWQAIYARKLHALLAGSPARPLTLPSLLRLAARQSCIQALGLFLLPVALVLALPFAWAYAFFHNAAAAGGEEDAGTGAFLRRIAAQTTLWPGQNHILIAILFLFGFVVFLNVAVALMQIPYLVKMFLGIETAFTRSGISALNTTFITAAIGLTYLFMNPLIKAVYVLRCFYGESLQTGADLKVQLKGLAPAPGIAALLILLAACGTAGAQENTSEAPSAVSAPELNESIDQVLSRPEFNWRLPRMRAEIDETEKGLFATFMDGLIATLRGWLATMKEWARKVVLWIHDAITWFREKFGGRKRDMGAGSGGGLSWIGPVQLMVFILLALLASALAILFWRMWKRRPRPEPVASQPVAPAPDLTDENVAADQLPEDGWLSLARELMQKGDLRLALRALYLASLAHLANREMIRIAKFKSNREYETELRRRARTLPEVQNAFSENVGLFDRAWYGMHEVTGEIFQRFEANMNRIKAC